MSEISAFIKTAKAGGSVYLHDVKAAFDREGEPVYLALSMASGDERVFPVSLLTPKGEDENAFIKDYFYARVYNILSMLGGLGMRVYTGASDYFYGLASSLPAVFGADVPRLDRTRYAKCLNVADRMNIALGAGPFRFTVIQNEQPPPEHVKMAQSGDIVAGFRLAAKRAMTGRFCGIDIGGTDIKLVGVIDGKLHHIKEYDWNPSGFTSVDGILDMVLLLARMTRAILSLPEALTPPAEQLVAEVLHKDASIAKIVAGVAAMEGQVKSLTPLDGIGVSFPDVVVRDKIVGGETHKTKGVREHSPDYEREFARLTALNERLKAYCKPGGSVHMANDGPISAYTAAAELAHSPDAHCVRSGIFAHSLGTELGSGWIDERGLVPEYPLEIYNCIIDLGNYPAKALPAADVRSINNFNTGLAGTLQRFTGQSGAFRLAEEYYGSSALRAYQALFDKGLLIRCGETLLAATEPKDMRKAFLEHLMAAAEAGEPEAQRIFRQIGEYLAATWIETDTVLRPACKQRVLFGRFVKRRKVFELMWEGAKALCPDIALAAADDGLAYTPLMCQLRETAGYTVAQFGQAVGAVHFAASVL